MSTSGVSEHVGFVGVGAMGSAIAERLTTHGHPVTVFDADRDRASAVAARLGVTAGVALDDLAACDVIITLLPTGRIVADVLVPGGRAADFLRPGLTVFDMGSSDPADTRATHAVLAAAEVTFADAAVSGGIANAVTGTLTVMVGGDDEVVRRATEIFEGTVAARILPTGEVGTAHAVKALNNLLSAGNLLLAIEALTTARRLRIDPDRFLEVVNSSSGQSRASETKLRQFVLSETFDAGFALALMAKDIGIARRLEEEAGVTASLSERVAALWSSAAQTLPADADHTAIAFTVTGDAPHSQEGTR